MRTALLWMVLFGTLVCAQETSTSATDVPLTTLKGEQLRLSNFRGRVVLLDFWASWCVPCKSEIPHFTRWQKQYGSARFQVIGVSMDDSEEAARSFATRLNINYPVAMGNEKFAEAFGGVLGLPANFIIDPEGKVVAKHVGVTDLKQLEREIRSQLDEK